MATNPSPDIEVLKNPPKRKRNHLPEGTFFPSEYKKTDKPFEDLKEEDEEEEWYESPNNFFYERKYLDL